MLKLSILGLLLSPLAFAGSDLSYRIEYVPGAAPQFAIELSVAGDADGTTGFTLPAEWAGQPGYEKGILDLTVTGGTLVQVSPIEVEVHHSPSALVTLRYRVVQHWSSGLNSDGFYWPMIRQDYFHFFGHAVFIRPHSASDQQYTIRVTWEGVPASWKIANSHGTEERSQVITATLSQFSHAIFLAGDYRIHRIEVNAKPIYLALRGQWAFTDAEFSDLTRRVFQSQRDFFQDYSYPYYFVSLTPSEGGRGSGGTGLTNSFAMLGAPMRELKPFEHLLSHELFHNWNGRKIRREQPEELQYWFSEGFTEYYARRIRLLSGTIDLREYVEGVNQALFEYSVSPAKNVTNDHIFREFWKDPAVDQIPYLRGEMIALLWSTRIRDRNLSKSLDHFMRDLFHEAVSAGTVVSSANVDRVIRPYLFEGVQSELASLVDRGDTVMLPSHALGPCASLVDRLMPTYDIGFDVDRSHELGLITDVRVDSAAYLAGLRDGQKLLRTQSREGDPFTPVTVTVELADGTRREIQYDPHGSKISVPQFVLDEVRFATNPAGCLSWFR
jgi:predicted metalloprotease with PDZ domain